MINSLSDEALAAPPAETGRDRARPSRSAEPAGDQGWRDDLRVVRLGSARAPFDCADLPALDAPPPVFGQDYRRDRMKLQS